MAAEPERTIMPTKKQWVYAPAKPKVPDEIKAEVQKKADQLVETFLKPNFIKPPPCRQAVELHRVHPHQMAQELLLLLLKVPLPWSDGYDRLL
jgi:hypothetical protein